MSLLPKLDPPKCRVAICPRRAEPGDEWCHRHTDDDGPLVCPCGYPLSSHNELDEPCSGPCMGYGCPCAARED